MLQSLNRLPGADSCPTSLPDETRDPSLCSPAHVHAWEHRQIVLLRGPANMGTGTATPSHLRQLLVTRIPWCAPFL